MDRSKSSAEIIKNIEAYQNDEAVEKYSFYGLYPNEKYLFLKYFSNDKRILDLACGSGRTTLRLHEMGYKVKGIDLSDRLINLGKSRFPTLTLEVGNYCDIKENDDTIDNILISHNGLDYAFPEEQRITAIKECHRVMKRGGTLIMSAHNIESLHFSPYYLKERKLWFLKNTFNAFKSRKYIYDLGMWTFYCNIEYCVKQFKKQGFEINEIIGFRNSHSHTFNRFISPYNHFVFQKT